MRIIHGLQPEERTKNTVIKNEFQFIHYSHLLQYRHFLGLSM